MGNEPTDTRGRKRPGDALAERRAREAAALRANLQKRKAQQRRREVGGGSGPIAPSAGSATEPGEEG